MIKFFDYKFKIQLSLILNKIKCLMYEMTLLSISKENILWNIQEKKGFFNLNAVYTFLIIKQEFLIYQNGWYWFFKLKRAIYLIEILDLIKKIYSNNIIIN